MKTARLLAVLFLFVLGNCSLASAGASIGISVSCTVPEIPGVNVPLDKSARQAGLMQSPDSEAQVQTFYPR